MASVLQYTGERLIPDQFWNGDRIVREHRNRYSFAAKQLLLKGGTVDRILDVPCGVGYGSRLLAEIVNAEVIGIDIDPASIAYASRRYSGNAYPDDFIMGIGATFYVGDMQEEAWAGHGIYFDAVVCFEGIEHVEDQQAAAYRMTQLLRTDGMLFVSTPRAHGPGSGSEFHTHELTLAELIRLYEPFVSIVDVLGQDIDVGDQPADDQSRFYVLVGRKR